MESVPADGRCLPSQQPKPFEGRYDLLSDMGPMVAPLGSSVSTLESRMSQFKNRSIDRLRTRRVFLSLKPDLLIIQAVQPPRSDLALLSAMWSLGQVGEDAAWVTISRSNRYRLD